MIYADIMSNSCVIIDDDEEEEGGGESKEEDENIDSFQESEMQKQKLLYEQNRLADTSNVLTAIQRSKLSSQLLFLLK